MKTRLLFVFVVICCVTLIGCGDNEKNVYVAPKEVIDKAQAGDAEAQYQVGMAYYELGGSANEIGAEMWLRSAAVQGHAGARYQLKQMGKDPSITGGFRMN